MDEQSSRRDLLSDLRLSIIHLILSFLPIRDAIGTSILSKKWRYLWASLPHLAFDEKCVLPIKNVSHEKRISHFITQTLFLHEGPIYTCELRLSGLSMRGLHHCIDQWLLFLSRNHIRNLLLNIYDSNDDDDDYGFGFFGIYSSLYLCQNLTHLKLYVNTFPPRPPSFKGFLCLRSLYIYMNKASPGTIETIVALYPLLEEFTLDWWGDTDIAIRAPNLKYDIAIRAPNLKYFDLEHGPHHLSLCTPLLEELIARFSFIKLFEESLVLCHLRIIKLFYSAYSDIKVLPMVIHLIKGAPNLQQLEISGHFYWRLRFPKLDSVSLWNMEYAPHLKYDNLKVIKMVGFGSYIDEMKLIELLLARSLVLEKMIYKREQSLSDKVLIKLMAQLLKFHRASANAEIVVLQ